MLSFTNRVAFLLFAAITLAWGLYGFVRLRRRILRGREDTDQRWNNIPRRVGYALVTTLMQSRTFRKRPWVSFFHSFIFYGFVYYLLVNLIDAVEGFVPFRISSASSVGAAYNLTADMLSALVLTGVVALLLRRFLLPSRHDFQFNARTLLHEDVRQRYVLRDSIIVSTFILFHVGSRAIGAGAKLVEEGPDRLQPFATLLSHLFTPANAHAWRDFGYWGALGSVLAFLPYFPWTKHVHIFMASTKYVFARDASSGVLPPLPLVTDDYDADLANAGKEPKLGAGKLEDLAWPRLLDAYACIQCNRCQDVCPATATGKSLSPSALEINKRMELNDLARTGTAFEQGADSPRPLLQFALTPEAAWACTTCGACMQACPVQDEPMLDIIDVRRQQVMMEGSFPAQLQSAFRGMERAQNPWGIGREKRLDWAEGLHVKTTDENPAPDVLYWVGCAASYDPQAQKTARAFVQLLQHAEVDFAVLGKRECCTGDSARRAGNEYLYRQLAETNVETLNEIRPKLIVATCPHCLNSVGKEYKQIGGDYTVMHHTEYLETLVQAGRLPSQSGSATVTYHDPCYLGRHNGVYDAPRNLLNIVSNNVVELERTRENGFCCGAGGAQFWKEEEEGSERISDNRFAEAQRTLGSADDKVLAVGCPFCKSMLQSTPKQGEDPLTVRDVAELLWEGVQRRSGETNAVEPPPAAVAIPILHAVSTVEEPVSVVAAPVAVAIPDATVAESPTEAAAMPTAPRKKWAPKTSAMDATATPSASAPLQSSVAVQPAEAVAPATERKKWTPKSAASVTAPITADAKPPEVKAEPQAAAAPPIGALRTAERRKWTPKAATAAVSAEPNAAFPEAVPVSEAAQASPQASAVVAAPSERKKWTPKAKKSDETSS